MCVNVVFSLPSSYRSKRAFFHPLFLFRAHWAKNEVWSNAACSSVHVTMFSNSLYLYIKYKRMDAVNSYAIEYMTIMCLKIN